MDHSLSSGFNNIFKFADRTVRFFNNAPPDINGWDFRSNRRKIN
ncbi:hypothetical protein BC792_10676 [Sphingobacterium allocomposti]|uniref:Uncharacterized protein n=1 Tax=Sphingobacterium allocomposti TaxID=415956 RepID=A0A5S5DLW5_9SPHI|nr:hypothetical protein BC792_10676 [Sphingobacterium composti Yoo et al. 2007 non Ten et al. 2007]